LLVQSTDVDHFIDLVGLGGSESVSCSGIIVSRRSQKNALFLSIDLLRLDNNNSSVPLHELEAQAQVDYCSIQLVLQADTHFTPCASALSNVTHLRKGALVSCVGRAVVDKPGSLSVYVTSFNLVRCSPDPTAIARLLEEIDPDCTFETMADMQSALFCTRVELLRLLQLTGKSITACLLGDLDLPDEVASKATTLSRAIGMHSRLMVGRAARRSRKREMRVKVGEMIVLEKSEQCFDAASLLFSGDSNDDEANPSYDVDGDQETICSDCTEHLPIGAFDAPSARGPLSRGEYYHGKKLPQVRWIVERLTLMHGSNMKPYRHYLDIGGGRGDLAFSVAQTFPSCIVTMIDRNKKSLDQARERAQVLGISSRMHFVCVALLPKGSSAVNVASCDNQCSVCSTDCLTEFLFREQQQQQQQEGPNSVVCSLPPVDCVLALHACGGLSDLALQCASTWRCAFLVVPCCYVKLPIDPSSWALTPSSKGDHIPFLSHCDRSIVLCLSESSTRELSCRASRVVNSERLCAVSTVIGGRSRLSVEYFPSSYSMRNAVLLCL
jgi:hypothetical protein